MNVNSVKLASSVMASLSPKSGTNIWLDLQQHLPSEVAMAMPSVSGPDIPMAEHTSAAAVIRPATARGPTLPPSLTTQTAPAGKEDELRAIIAEGFRRQFDQLTSAHDEKQRQARLTFNLLMAFLCAGAVIIGGSIALALWKGSEVAYITGVCGLFTGFLADVPLKLYLEARKQAEDLSPDLTILDKAINLLQSS